MLALTDKQLQTVMLAARSLETERRDVYLQRVSAMLMVRRRFTDADVAQVSQLALYGLIQRAHEVT